MNINNISTLQTCLWDIDYIEWNFLNSIEDDEDMEQDHMALTSIKLEYDRYNAMEVDIFFPN